MANIIEFDFEGLYNSKAECKTPRNRCYEMSNCWVDEGILQVFPRYSLFGARSGASSGDIGWGLGYGRYTGNAVQVITLNNAVTGGGFYLRWRPTTGDSWQTSSAIIYDSTLEEFKIALETMAYIDDGDIRVSGGPFPSRPITVQFQGQYANTTVELLEVTTNTLTGASSAISIVETSRGGDNERYLAVVQHQGASTASLYSINTAGTYTQITSGLDPSDWFFQQYQSKIYAINKNDGLLSFTIGSTTDSSVQLDIQPTLKPRLDYLWDDAEQPQDSGTGIGLSTTGFAVTPNQSWYRSGTSTVMQLGFTTSTFAASSQCTATVTLPTSGRPNWQFNDVFAVSCLTQSVSATQQIKTHIDPSSFKMILVDVDDTELEPDLQYTEIFSETPYYQHWNYKCMHVGSHRQERRVIKKIIFKFTPTAIGQGENFYMTLARPFWGWMADDRTANLSNGAKTAKFDYAYSYYRVSDGAESKLSEAFKSDTFPYSSDVGGYIRVTPTYSPGLTASDKIYIYRKSKKTGLFHRLPNADETYGITNTAGVYLDDHYMEHELEEFPQYEFTNFPEIGGGNTTEQVGCWKQCLCVGSSKQVWISKVGMPEAFEDSPDNIDSTLVVPQADDLTRGKTEYVSDNRSEDIYGIHGQDSLYLVTPNSTFAIIGDMPAESTPPRRLPESRGTLGYRSSYRLGGGVLSAAEDGLWYYSVGRGFSGEDNGTLVAKEVSEDVRNSYSSTFLAGSRTATGVVVCEYDNQLWLFNGNKYLCQSRNRQWHEGTYGISVKAAMPVRHLGLRVLDSTGRLLTISPSYTTDEGSSVEWSYTTGIIDGMRNRLRKLHIRGEGTPKVRIEALDGLHPTIVRTYQPTHDSQNYVASLSLTSGFRYQFTFSGTSTDTIEYLALEMEGTSEGIAN